MKTKESEMDRSKQHERLNGQEREIQEKPVHGGRLDAGTRIKAVEIERTRSTQNLKNAIEKLQNSRKELKVFRVPQNDVYNAAEIARQ